jgi:hypothetical protein
MIYGIIFEIVIDQLIKHNDMNLLITSSFYLLLPIFV